MHAQTAGTAPAAASTEHSKGTPIIGYYLDLSAPPVGGRPVHRAYNITEGNTVNDSGNLLDRQFDCRQPVWKWECI